MKIGIGLTKDKKWTKILSEGCEKKDIRYATVDSKNASNIAKQLDILIMVGYHLNGIGLDNQPRYKMLNDIKAKNPNIKVIFFDRGMFDRIDNSFISINKPKFAGGGYLEKYKNNNERWDKIFSKVIKVEDWKNNSTNIISVLLHNVNGYKSCTIRPKHQVQAARKVCGQLRTLGYEVELLYHPKYKKDCETKIWNYITNSKFCVGWHSHVLCNTIIRGIPCVCLDNECLAFDMCSHSVTEDPIMPDRQQWLNSMSWGNWSRTEISNGDYWDIILPELNI